MVLAVASGKGGTGKTTVAAALASVWPEPLVAVDLDVEEPNLHLFLKPEISGREKAFLEVPLADEAKCTACRACAELCQFKAVVVLGRTLMVFPEMCHGCGGCLLVCPEKALIPGQRELGEVSWGRSGELRFLMGRLRVGEAMSPPLMRSVKDRLKEMLAQAPAEAIVDAPPGVSCPAVNAVMDADVILLVTEPTPFGFYDLKLAVEAFRPLGKPTAVVINRAGLGDRKVHDFCQEAGLPILAEIPYDRKIAETYAKGRVIVDKSPQLTQLFVDLAGKLRSLAQAA